MTVSSIVPVNNYEGNGSTKIFDFDFLIENTDELKVIHISEDGINTALIEGVDYSVNEVGNKNGSYITFPLETSSFPVLKTNERISLALDLSIKQESKFENSAYLNLSVLEWTFDYIVRVLQILNRKIERCVKINEGSENSPDELIDEINDSVSFVKNCADSTEELAQTVENNKNFVVEKVNSFNTLVETTMEDITSTGITTKADVSLNNLSSTGEKHFLNKTQISNCILEAPNGVLTYSGNIITLKQGLKVLIPNGLNSDGTLNNIEAELTADNSYTITYATTNQTVGMVKTASGCALNISNEFIISEIQPEASPFILWYNPKTNIMKRADISGSFYITQEAVIATNVITNSSGTILNIIPKQTVNLLKRSDKSEISGYSKPSKTYTDLTLGTSGLTYTAPANGFFTGSFVSTGTSSYFLAFINGTNHTTCLYELSDYATKADVAMTFFAPVKQGDYLCLLIQNAAKTVFKFIYDEGET